MNNIAIITARGGSKRIPRKNIKIFIDKPIIAYSIEASLESGLFSEVMVSTDDEEIAEIALKYGAKVPFYRTLETSDDFSTTEDVLIEVLDMYGNNSKSFVNACCLYPTAPFVTKEKLLKAYDLLILKDADSVIPVSSFSYPIWRSLKENNGFLEMNFPENNLKRSQDLPSAFHDTGQFYMFNVKSFYKQKDLFSEKCVPIIIPELEMQDIDNITDWEVAELKYSYLKMKGII